MLAYEKEVLGYYVTSNPLSHHAETINSYSNCNSSLLSQLNGEKQVTIGGMITRIRYNITKSGRNAGAKMAVFTLEDLQGQIEVVLFPDALNKYSSILAEDSVVFVKGKADTRRETVNIIADELIPLDKATERLAASVRIKLTAENVTTEKITRIKSICQHHRGKSLVYIAIDTPHGRVTAAADKQLSVTPDTDFCREIKQLIGERNLILTN